MARVARSTRNRKTGNTLTFRTAVIQFQICPGGFPGVGIGGEKCTLWRGKRRIGQGKLHEEGWVIIRILVGETLTLKVFDTDYEIHMPQTDQLDKKTMLGQRQLSDKTGYLTGYLLSPYDNDLVEYDRAMAATLVRSLLIDATKQFRNTELSANEALLRKLERGDAPMQQALLNYQVDNKKAPFGKLE